MWYEMASIAKSQPLGEFVIRTTTLPHGAPPPDQFFDLLAECETPEWKLKVLQDHRILREAVYVGLLDLNTGFDSPLIGQGEAPGERSLGSSAAALDAQMMGWVTYPGPALS